MYGSTAVCWLICGHSQRIGISRSAPWLGGAYTRRLAHRPYGIAVGACIIFHLFLFNQCGGTGMDSTRGKVVWITGSTSGIGRALAYEYANRNATVVLTGRRLDRLQSLATALTSRGCSVLPLLCDV